ncbi:hypothetical protein [Kitasatospora purpeofusca]|uniref:hypothetical protein n=1 Tax=Kitasatospora purpeofusca TaxID=67352 RepID=UPI0038286209
MSIQRPRLPRVLRGRRVQVTHVSPVKFPCLLVDGDGWVMPCADDDELQGLTEPDFIDDIVAAFDASACPLELRLVGDGQIIGLAPAGDPQPNKLTAHVRAYFHRWTDREAPVILHPLQAYVTEVAATIHGTPVRRRPRS